MAPAPERFPVDCWNQAVLLRTEEHANAAGQAHTKALRKAAGYALVDADQGGDQFLRQDFGFSAIMVRAEIGTAGML